MTDNVNSPSHYQIGSIESINIIQELLTPDQFNGWFEGNILNYMFRWKKKNGVEDLRKAIFYLNLLIDRMKTKEFKEKLEEIKEKFGVTLQDCILVEVEKNEIYI